MIFYFKIKNNSKKVFFIIILYIKLLRYVFFNKKYNYFLLRFDFYVNTAREVHFHQGIDSFSICGVYI